MKENIYKITNKMIDIIIEEEKILWSQLKSSLNKDGHDSQTTSAIRNQWYAIYRLMQKLELK